MTRSFSALTKDLGPERRVRIEQRKEQLRQEMTLAELRRAFSLTQDTLARTLNVKQAEISKIENRADMLMSTLRNFVQAMGGDLDPTKGMYWTWQSGYVNFKAEGFYEKCPTRQGAFQFHLGGYMPPFLAARRIQIAATPGKNQQLQLDLTPFVDQVNWAKKHSIMSPGAETVRLSNVLATSFRLHAD
jgi:DNA-binding XRE family transcriptional regulator